MQTATNVVHARHTADCSRARALIRFNALMFHSIAAASILETAAPLHTQGLLRAVAMDPDAVEWVDKIWRRQREARGRELRAYIEATWPEFDWGAAYEDFLDECRKRPGSALSYAHPALEAVARCTIEAQAAAFYRAVANSADDPVLRELAATGASDHAGCFGFFRSFYERCARHRRVGFAVACRTVLETTRSARDSDVAAAFQPLAANWYGIPTVTELGYQDFVTRMARLITRHAALGRLERLLFRSWTRRATPILQSSSGRRQAARTPQLALRPAA